MLRERLSTFVHAVARGLTGPEAAREAGYTGQPESLRKAAYRLRKNPVVQAELARIRQEDRGRALARRREVLEVLTRQLRATLADCFDVQEAGTKGKVRRLVVNEARALAVCEKVRRDPSTGKIVSLELPSVQGAVDRLARLLGWFPTEKHQVEHNLDLATLMAQLSDEEVERPAGAGSQ